MQISHNKIRTNLSPKQESFVNLYVKYRNGTKACIESGYSVKSARSIATDLLTKSHIRQAIDDKLKVISGVSYTQEEAEKDLVGIIKSESAKNSDKILAISLIGKVKAWYSDAGTSNIAILSQLPAMTRDKAMIEPPKPMITIEHKDKDAETNRPEVCGMLEDGHKEVEGEAVMLPDTEV